MDSQKFPLGSLLLGVFLLFIVLLPLEGSANAVGSSSEGYAVVPGQAGTGVNATSYAPRPTHRGPPGVPPRHSMLIANAQAGLSQHSMELIEKITALSQISKALLGVAVLLWLAILVSLRRFIFGGGKKAKTERSALRAGGFLMKESRYAITSPRPRNRVSTPSFLQ